MNSNRSSVLNNHSSIFKAPPVTQLFKPLNINKIKQRLHKKLSTKYCTCQNYMTINQINRTLADKQCILKTTLNDIKFDGQEQKMQEYYNQKKCQSELPELIQYYKYYSQKSVLFIKEYFPILYHYQQKRKVIQYNRLKILLNLSDSGDKKQNQSYKKYKQNQSSAIFNKSRIGISRNHIYPEKQIINKVKGYKGVNILDELEQTKNSTNNQNQESFLIKRLRNNLSKHIGPSEVKNLTIEQLDKQYNFTKKNDAFKQNSNIFLLPTGKSKVNPLKTAKFSREQTHTNTPQEFKNSKNIRRRSAKRNNSCQNLTRATVNKSPYQNTANKLRRKKNLSMDNIYTHTSTPYMPQQKSNIVKMKKITVKVGQKQRYIKQKQNTVFTKGQQTFFESISDLKNKIKKQKQKLLNKFNPITNSINNLTSYKRQKVQYSSINTANQRFSKKNYQKLRQKTVNNFL